MDIKAIQTGVVHVKADFLAGSAAAGSTIAFMARLFTALVLKRLSIGVRRNGELSGRAITENNCAGRNYFAAKCGEADSERPSARKRESGERAGLQGRSG